MNHIENSKKVIKKKQTKKNKQIEQRFSIQKINEWHALTASRAEQSPKEMISAELPCGMRPDEQVTQG